MKLKIHTLLLAAGLIGLISVQSASAGAIRPGFNSSALAANDDLSTGLVPIGFTINFFGVSGSQLYVNNNGNVTFDNPMWTYTPFDLTSTGERIIAPFFGDVDTRPAGSDLTRYGAGTVDGHAAFGVTWDGVGVGYYSYGTDKLNNFQLVIIDRSDVGAGDFDFEFNYDQIQWETGDASGGVNGLGGSSARAGYSNGLTGTSEASYEIAGSAVNGAFLDNNLVTGLIHNSINSSIDGRYLFTVRNGQVDPVPTPDAGASVMLLGLALAGLGFFRRSLS